MKNRKTIILEKLKESFSSVFPIVLIVLLLSFTLCPLENDTFLAFIIGSLMLTVGLGLFLLGSEMSMTKIGSHVGANLTKSRKIPIIASIALVVGVLITVSEPDLHVLAGYAGEAKWPFIFAVALGLGIFLVIAVLRIIFNIKIKYILLVGYGTILLLSMFVSEELIAIAYDSGGVTTGAMSVSFVMSIGAGIAAMSDQRSGEDSTFGLMAICSIGPVISILIMSLFGMDVSYYPHSVPNFSDSQQMGLAFLRSLPQFLRDVSVGLLPIIVFFLIFQLFTEKVHKKDMLRIFIGAAYMFVGIVTFLVGANVGFMPVGSAIGTALASSPIKWSVVPVGMILGFFIIFAEPAVGVLEHQVEEATSGSIPKKILTIMMAVGVSISAGIALLRAMTGISILPFLIVGYVIAVVLAFVAPPTFVSLAFDGGGVASGVMTATFLLPLAIGVCEAANGSSQSVMSDAFGTIALVAMAPAISIQLLGLYHKHKSSHALKGEIISPEIQTPEILEFDESEIEIIDFDVDNFRH